MVNNKGFTLIELLIVVAIIGIIAAIAVPNLLDAIDRSKQKASVAEIRLWGIAMQEYLAATNKLPPCTIVDPEGGQPVDATLKALLVPFTINTLPLVDKWDHPYYYRNDVTDPTSYSMRSCGKDGICGVCPVFCCSPTKPRGFYDLDMVLNDGVFVYAPS